MVGKWRAAILRAEDARAARVDDLRHLVLTGGLEDVQRPDNNDLRAKARLFLASGRQNRCKVDNRVASLRGIDHTIAISDVARAPVDVLGILSGDAADNAPVFVDIKHPDVVAAGKQPPDYPRTDKPGTTGHKNLRHSFSIVAVQR